MGRKLMLLALAVVLMMVYGCGSKGGDNKQASENLDVSYYRKIMMLPDGTLLCSLEVSADKVPNAGAVYKVGKKDGKIRKVTLLYDGEKWDIRHQGRLKLHPVLDDINSIIKPGWTNFFFEELEIIEKGEDLIYQTQIGKNKLEDRVFRGAAVGKPTVYERISTRCQLKYDDKGRCISKTGDNTRIEYSYEGDSVLPVSLCEFGSDGKKKNIEIPSMKWDEHNRLIAVVLKDNAKSNMKSYFDYVNASSPGVDTGMAEQVRLYYEGDNPNPFSVRAYSRSGKSVVSTETRVHEYAYRYDDKFNLISVESLGLHGQPVMAIKFDADTSHSDTCCAAVRCAYDEKGRRIAVATYGADGRPVNSYKGYAEIDTPYWEEYKNEISYFGALGQPVDCKLDKKIASYHRRLAIGSKDSGKGEIHYYMVSGKWIGVEKGKEKGYEFSDSTFSKNDECDKRAKEPARAIILDQMGMMKFVHEDKPVNDQTSAAIATSQSNSAPANSGSTVSMEPKSPEQILQLFHQNLTSKDYRKAYHFLSKNFQSSAPYDGWAAGFQTTVSSTVSDVKVESQTGGQTILTYTLKAVDNPGGTKYFRGTAVFIWTDAHGWRIDDMTNKPM